MANPNQNPQNQDNDPRREQQGGGQHKPGQQEQSNPRPDQKPGQGGGQQGGQR